HIRSIRGEDEKQRHAYEEMGIPDQLTLVGPFSSFHVLQFDEETQLERDGSMAGPFRGPFGEIQPRRFSFLEPRFDLEGEPNDGDVYFLTADVEVQDAADHLLRAVGTTSFK